MCAKFARFMVRGCAGLAPHRVPVAAAATLLLAGVSPASADPVSLVRYERYLYASSLVYGPSGFVESYAEERQLTGTSASATAVLGTTTATASTTMTDTLSADAHRLTGSATSGASITGAHGGAQSTAALSFWFDLTSAHAFDFSADVSSYGFGSWQAHLVQSPLDSGNQILRFTAISNTGADQLLRFRGSLDPGSYAFSIRADASADTYFSLRPNGGGRFDFTYEMAPVPEPASLLLVGTGVFGVIARARRRRRGEPAQAPGGTGE